MSLLRPSIASLIAAVDPLVLPNSGGGLLPVRSRLRVALRTAIVNESPELQHRLAQRMRASGWSEDVAIMARPAQWVGLGAADEALLELADQMATDPADLGPEDLVRMHALGVDGPAVVATGQVVAYASFLSRLDRGLALLGNPGAAGAPQDLPPLRQILPPDASAFPTLVWGSWVAPAEVPRRDGDGLPPKLTPFYRTLAHEPEILAARTSLYDEIMTGEGSLSRAEREFVALVTSLTTGCEYCATVHGKRHMQLSGDRVTAPGLAAVGAPALTTPRHRALASLGSHVALTPPQLDAADLRALEDVELSREQIADAIAVASLFAWANRLMLTLGAPLPH